VLGSFPISKGADKRTLIGRPIGHDTIRAHSIGYIPGCYISPNLPRPPKQKAWLADESGEPARSHRSVGLALVED